MRLITDMRRRYIVTDEDGNTDVYTFGDIVTANQDDDDALLAIDTLGVGQAVTFGGGAEPRMRVERAA